MGEFSIPLRGMKKARAGIEPAIELLQSPALPLGYLADTRSDWGAGGSKIAILVAVNSLESSQEDQMIIPAATVSLVWESIRMKLPVVRLRR